MKALRAKGLIKKEFDKAFQKYDCILAPASPTTAPKIGTSLSDPLQMYLSDIYTVAVNLAGLPAVSLPCGMDSRGLPIGMQLIGDCFQEKKILRAAAAYEQLRGSSRRTCHGNENLLRMLHKVWCSTEYPYLPGLYRYARIPPGIK